MLWDHQISALAATLVAINVKWAVMGNKIMGMKMIMEIGGNLSFLITDKDCSMFWFTNIFFSFLGEKVKATQDGQDGDIGLSENHKNWIHKIIV